MLSTQYGELWHSFRTGICYNTDPTLPKTPRNYISQKGGRGRGEGEAAATSIFIDLRKQKFTLSNALVNANKIIATRCRGVRQGKWSWH